MSGFLDIESYERMTPEECWKRHGWGCEALPGTTVLHKADDDDEVFVDEVDPSYGGRFACELYFHGDFMASWFDDDMLDAIRGAFVESIGLDVMREEACCEDAVNCIARDAYVMLFGDCDLMAMDVNEVDELLKMARGFVKANVKWVDYEWEEY